jgi:FAD/FMN-containing dehydrogenase
MTFLDQLRAQVGAANVLTDAAEVAPYLTDWRGNFQGRARAVVRPGNTAEVAGVLACCAASAVPLVPQSGNTGLVLGGVPDASGEAIVLSLRRMNRVRAVDVANNTLTVDAGMVLQQVQQVAAQHDRLYPVSLAAEGSACIGGTIATNAGGVQVLRYGTTREQVLGLEAVLADGRVWHGLKGLRKDNTGYNLTQLLIGSEGTLAVITAATVKLWPRPRSVQVAMAALPSLTAASRLLTTLQSRAGDRLTAFEAMQRTVIDLLLRHIPNVQEPFTQPHPWYALIELADTDADARLAELLEAALEPALECGDVVDAVLATSEAQAAALWNLRENAPEAEKRQGRSAKHDISLPLSAIADFVAETDTLLRKRFPGILLVNFGHLGDGNLHYNCTGIDREAAENVYRQSSAINRLVYDQVAKFGGSISAEHGLGRLKHDLIRKYRPPLDLELMRAVKQALDPQNILNPGVIV